VKSELMAETQDNVTDRRYAWKPQTTPGKSQTA